MCKISAVKFLEILVCWYKVKFFRPLGFEYKKQFWQCLPISHTIKRPFIEIEDETDFGKQKREMSIQFLGRHKLMLKLYI